MKEGRGSRTAEHNALFRALEACLPASRRVVDDPLAGHFLTWPLSLVPRLARLPGLREILLRFVDGRWPGVRTSLVARTRLIDDWIAGLLREGPEQLVLLGAGFDTRAYRLAGLEGLAVFEVDHPDTQRRKRRVVERALPEAAARVRFVASDFREGGLDEALRAAGHRAEAPTLVLWEGVTNYLTEAAVDATLRWCAGGAPGSRLVFTYVHRAILTTPETFAGSRQLFAALARAGEPFRFGIDPDELAGYLAARGLALERDLGASEYRALYYGDAARGMRGHEFYRVAAARVAQAPPAGPC